MRGFEVTTQGVRFHTLPARFTSIVSTRLCFSLFQLEEGDFVGSISNLHDLF